MRRMPVASGPPRVSVLDVAVFFDELVLLAMFAISAMSVDATIAVRVALAVTVVVVTGLIWGRWLAPRASHPIAYPRSVGAKLFLFGLAALAFASSDHVVAAVLFLVVSSVLVVASERARHRLVS